MKQLVTVLSFSTVLLAVVPTANAYWEYNFLLGASAGYADRGGDLKFNSTSAAPANEPTSFSVNHTDNGFIWGVLGGVQATCNRWVFGAELSVDWHDFDENTQYTRASTAGMPVLLNARYEQGTIVGFSFRAGYEMAPSFLPYVRIGAETSSDKFATNGSVGAGGTSVFVLEDSKNVYRFLLGIGLEIPLRTIPGLAFRGEYNYHSKGKMIKSEGVATGTAPSVGSSIKTDAHAAKFSVVWNFV